MTSQSQTLRYYAATRHVYATAITELALYARTSQDDFEVSPATAAAMEHQGITVSGPDLAGVRKVLDAVEGLTRG